MAQFDKFLKYIPIAYAFLVLLGFMRLYAYYNYFGIYINDYLDLSFARAAIFLPSSLHCSNSSGSGKN